MASCVPFRPLEGEPIRLVRHVLRWIVLGTIVGVLAGLSSAALLTTLTWATDRRVANPWLLYLLPLGVCHRTRLSLPGPSRRDGQCRVGVRAGQCGLHPTRAHSPTSACGHRCLVAGTAIDRWSGGDRADTRRRQPRIPRALAAPRRARHCRWNGNHRRRVRAQVGLHSGHRRGGLPRRRGDAVVRDRCDPGGDDGAGPRGSDSVAGGDWVRRRVRRGCQHSLGVHGDGGRVVRGRGGHPVCDRTCDVVRLFVPRRDLPHPTGRRSEGSGHAGRSI